MKDDEIGWACGLHVRGGKMKDKCIQMCGAETCCVVQCAACDTQTAVLCSVRLAIGKLLCCAVCGVRYANCCVV